MSAPTIAVVIPTYERRSLVLEALASVLAQTRPADEIVVVDDGSTDGTADAIAQECGERVRVVVQENGGAGAARHAAIGQCRSDWIALLDDDDLWLPHHLATIDSLVAAHPEAVLATTERDFRQGNEPPEKATVEELIHLLLRGIGMIGETSTVAVRRDAYLAVGGFDVGMRHGQDTDLFIRVALLGPVVRVAATTMQRRVLSDGLSTYAKRTGAYLDATRRSTTNLIELLERLGREDTSILRNLALAREARAEVFAAIEADASPRQVRIHLAAMIRRRPEFLAHPEIVLFQLPGTTYEWRRLSRRVRVVSTLLRAWPSRSGFIRLCWWSARVVARPR
jgi:glycosyltransferase involved in cell wall biosynthesis